MGKNWIFLVFLIASPAWAEAGPVDGWTAWLHGLSQKCPTRHVDWICDGCYLDYLDDFTKTLPARTQKQVTEIAYHPDRCASETMGFSCEMSVTLEAIRKLGLMDRLVNFSCEHYKCDDEASCTRS